MNYCDASSSRHSHIDRRPTIFPTTDEEHKYVLSIFHMAVPFIHVIPKRGAYFVFILRNGCLGKWAFQLRSRRMNVTSLIRGLQPTSRPSIDALMLSTVISQEPRLPVPLKKIYRSCKGLVCRFLFGSLLCLGQGNPSRRWHSGVTHSTKK